MIKQVKIAPSAATATPARKRAIGRARRYGGSAPAKADPATQVRAGEPRQVRGAKTLLQVYCDHQRLDARSLAMHCIIAKRLLTHPELIDKARATLARWKAKVQKPVPAYFFEWERILGARPEAIAGFIASMSEDAIRLRQSSPFTNVLTTAERSKIYALLGD